MFEVEYVTPTGTFTSSPFTHKDDAIRWARSMTRKWTNFRFIEIREVN